MTYTFSSLLGLVFSIQQCCHHLNFMKCLSRQVYCKITLLAKQVRDLRFSWWWTFNSSSSGLWYQCFRGPCCLHLQGEVTGDPNPSHFVTNGQSVSQSCPLLGVFHLRTSSLTRGQIYPITSLSLRQICTENFIVFTFFYEIVYIQGFQQSRLCTADYALYLYAT
jgi:hypothetical protein